MMMCDLPMDLVHEILSRVPATSLKRLRSVCKLWHALFKDQRFTEMHYLKAAKEYLVLILKDFRISLMSVNFNAQAPSAQFRSILELKASYSTISEQVDICAVFHCDGLLLCSTGDDRLVVWNPCLDETRWIQSSGFKSLSKIALGYQKHKSIKSYKILRCWGCYKPYYHVAGFEIYDFSTNSWRVDDVALHFFVISIGVSLKGNSYWLARNDEERDNSLVCFNFTSEKFKSVCSLPFECCGWMAISVVRDEQLSVLYHDSLSSKMEIWITNRIGTDTEDDADALLWRKAFTMDSLPDMLSYGFPMPESFLIDQEKKLALCCNGRATAKGSVVYIIGEENAYYTQIPDDESTKQLWWSPTIFNYVPSLVQIQ